MYSSLVPCAYTFAVSMKLTPSSKARAMTAWVSSCPITHWWKSGKVWPKLMPPMHRRGISMSVWPRAVMAGSSP